MASLFSPSWYRVAALKPRLRSHIHVHRQPYGDELAYLLQDSSTGKFYRFNSSAHDIIGRMNGGRTVHEIWEAAVAHLGDEAPSQEDTIELLGRLHSVDALQVSVTPDCLELFRRSEKSRRQGWVRALRSPLSIRLPLIDPDRALAKVLPALGPLFCRKTFVVWVVLVGWALFIAARHWAELTAEVAQSALEPKNLVLLAIIYPLVKVLHELGHAITTKKWGGEVHEMGLTLLVFVPIPYVDASAASAIRSKYQRMVVGAAGMMVELFLAAIALLVWLNVEPGLTRQAALNVMLISGVSTVVFNGNPLLRFDAYYILKDAIEVPNLGARSTQQVVYLVQRYLLGMEDTQSPATRAGERRWLFFYGVTSTLYRLSITFGIILFIAGEFFLFGVLLAIWATAVHIVMPLMKQASFLLFDRRLQRGRVRAVGVSGALLGAVLMALFLAPVPAATHTEGVIWLPEHARLRAGTDGHVKAVLVPPFTEVRRGQPLIELEDLQSSSRLNVLAAELEELRIRYHIEMRRDLVKAGIQQEEIVTKEAELERERERASNLVIKSSSDGVFVLPHPDDLPGRYVRQGDEVGLVVDPSDLSIRAVVSQDDVGLVRERLVGVRVKLAEAIERTIPARITRTVPAAEGALPSKVLGSAGGGQIAVNPKDERGLTPLRSVFQYDIALDEDLPAWRIGERVYVKFDHGKEPLAYQWYRIGRQLFLARFGV